MDTERILARLVQSGTVTVVDGSRRRARVKFQDTGIISGWLQIIQHCGGGVSVTPDGGHTHTITDTYSGGGGASMEPDHSHCGTTTTVWLPEVNDTVLVLYLPIKDGDGFILGGI